MVAVALLSSCIKDDYAGPDPDLPTRTVLVYLGGDNSLSATLTGEVEALRKGWTYTGNRCLVYLDAADAAPRLLSLRGGCQTYPEPFVETVAEYPEENSASAAVFARMIDDVVRMYPADSYGLIFASHASGWLPEGTLANPNRSRSIGIDTNPGTLASGSTEMELADFAAAIPDGQFDFIIFEACLMAGVEVAYELRDKTDYMLASSAEMLVPGFVPVYPSSLHYLMETKYTVEQSLTAFASDYYDNVNAQSGAYRSMTLSILKTQEMEAIATRTGCILSQALDVSDIASIQHFDRPGSYGDYPVAPRYFDFMDCMERLASPTDYAALESLLNETVVWKAATPTFMNEYNGFSITKHSGLTLYIEQDCFAKLNEAYCETAWYAATHSSRMSKNCATSEECGNRLKQ